MLPTAETPLPTFPPALLVTQCEMESGAGDTVVRSFVSTRVRNSDGALRLRLSMQGSISALLIYTTFPLFFFSLCIFFIYPSNLFLNPSAIPKRNYYFFFKLPLHSRLSSSSSSSSSCHVVVVVWLSRAGSGWALNPLPTASRM